MARRRAGRLVQRLHVESDEPLPLRVGDLQMMVDIDDVLKAKLAGEAVGAAERFRREPRQAVDVMRSPLREQRLQHWIGKDLRVKQLLEPVQRLFSASVLVQAYHLLTSVMALSSRVPHASSSHSSARVS